MGTTTLSDHALALLCRHLAGERVEVTEETTPLYCELSGAGPMMPLHTLALGPNSAYRLPAAACNMRDAMRVSGHASPAPSAGASLSPRG